MLKHFTVLAAILAFAPAVLGEKCIDRPPRVQKIVSFGDSLTDTGACAELTKNNGPIIPSNAYYKNRFSSGPVWLDYLTSAKKLAVNNFAVGGATTDDALVQGWVGGKFGEPLRKDGTIQKVPSAATQLQSYLKKQDENKKNILYTVFVGANDNFDNDILKLGKTGAYFAAAQTAIWNTLVKNGASQILSIVLPKELGDFYASYGASIDTQVADFKKANPNVKIFKYEVPVTVFLPTSYNPPLIGDPAHCCNDCFNGLPPTGNATVCSNPDAYSSWEGLHPTTVVHKSVANGIADFIGANFGF
ncbi:hypothetical protein BJ742DRAFT_874919 [Cladochytrium replicatum]|nr:hypothetical protein BJ742DRAFT_874919 [Cladochytrium replicatum]